MRKIDAGVHGPHFGSYVYLQSIQGLKNTTKIYKHLKVRPVCTLPSRPDTTQFKNRAILQNASVRIYEPRSANLDSRLRINT